MAVKTIDELAAANNIADTDVFIIDDGARNYKVAWSVLKRLIGSISNFTVDNTVGTITITLSTGASLTVTPHDPTKQDSLTFDSTPTAGSSNPVTSGGIKAALDDKLDAEDYAVFTGANASTAGSAGIVPAPAAGNTRFLSSSGAWTAPDSTPTAGSSNLPTSGGVKAALDGKQDELTFDTAPTAGSDNPVTSGGVFDAIKQSTANKAKIKSYIVSPNSDLSITSELPRAYILFVRGYNGYSLGAVIGVGYGERESRHKINKIIEPSNVTIAVDDTVYGLNIHNSNPNIEVTVYVIDCAI